MRRPEALAKRSISWRMLPAGWQGSIQARPSASSGALPSCARPAATSGM